MDFFLDVDILRHPNQILIVSSLYHERGEIFFD